MSASFQKCLRCNKERYSNKFYYCSNCGSQFCKYCLVPISEQHKMGMKNNSNWICLTCSRVILNSEIKFNKDNENNKLLEPINIAQKNLDPSNYYYIHQPVVDSIHMPIVVPFFDNYSNSMYFPPSFQGIFPFSFNPYIPMNFEVSRDFPNPFLLQRNESNKFDSIKNF